MHWVACLRGVFRGISQGSENLKFLACNINNHPGIYKSMKQHRLSCVWQHICMQNKWVQGKVLAIRNLHYYSKESMHRKNEATGIDIIISPKISDTETICHLFNLTLTSGVIPQEWEVHVVVPVYKSGDRSSIADRFPFYVMPQKY